MKKKTDNSDPRTKLELRRYFLRKYHPEPPEVLDCCQGEGILWQTLRKELELRSYWGADIKQKRGRLKIDSVRILTQSGWSANVVDVDTYGSPWRHWRAMLPNIRRPTTVFLSHGLYQMGTPWEMLAVLDLNDLSVPQAIARRLHDLATISLLAEASEHDLAIREACEAVGSAHPIGGLHCRYFGIRLEPQRSGGM